MGVAILNPQNHWKDSLSTYNLSPHTKYPRNPSAAKKKPISNRPRRSPPRPTTARSPPLTPSRSPPRSPSSTVEKSKIVAEKVRILKRGEEIPKETSDLVVEKSDLVSTPPIEPVPKAILSTKRVNNCRSKLSTFYAGPVTMTSPPPSDVPLPGFFSKSAATSDLIKMLRLDIASL